MNSVTSSVGFVITAIYTVTFANAIYQMVTFDETAVRIMMRDTITLPTVCCAAICMTMALRFFFGNNNFVDSMFSKPHTTGVRLYHFATIAIQSLILLGSSYLIRNPLAFVEWLLLLFLVEVLWYVGCLVFDKSAVLAEGRFNRSLLVNECANLTLAISAAYALRCLVWTTSFPVYFVTGFFVVNTVIDLKVNLRSYMGEDNGGQRQSS